MAPNTKVAAPSSAMDASSSRIGGTRSFHFCARTRPSAPPTSPPSPEMASASVSAESPPPGHQVLGVEREHEQPEPPELIPQHLERHQAQRRGRARRDLLDARDDAAHHLRRLSAERGLVRCVLHVLHLAGDERGEDQHPGAAR